MECTWVVASDATDPPLCLAIMANVLRSIQATLATVQCHHSMGNIVTKVSGKRSTLPTASFILILFYFYSIFNQSIYFKINVIRNVIQL